jgi:hypothetical protein
MSQNSDNDWGWFVDIELPVPTKKMPFITSLKPIVEQPTESNQPLRNDTLMFQMDDDIITPKTNKCSRVDIILHAVGFILCYFVL